MAEVGQMRKGSKRPLERFMICENRSIAFTRAGAMVLRRGKLLGIAAYLIWQVTE